MDGVNVEILEKVHFQMEQINKFITFVMIFN